MSAVLPATSEPQPAFGARLLRWADRSAPVMGFVIVLTLWELACRVFPIPSFVLPSPWVIVKSTTELSIWIWLDHTWATLRVAIMGYLAAIVISIPLALALANSKLLSRTMLPLLIVIQSTPIVAVAPIIVVMLGTSDLPRVVITFLITFFPIVVSTVTGLLATPPELIELSRSLRASRVRQILHVRLPYALPYVFSALKISTTLAVIGAVVAEFVAAEKGLGYFILFSTQFFKIPHAFAALVLLVCISLLLYRLVVVIQVRFVPWSLPPG